jgi:hypothetical protein
LPVKVAPNGQFWRHLQRVPLLFCIGPGEYAMVRAEFEDGVDLLGAGRRY